LQHPGIVQELARGRQSPGEARVRARGPLL